LTHGGARAACRLRHAVRRVASPASGTLAAVKNPSSSRTAARALAVSCLAALAVAGPAARAQDAPAAAAPQPLFQPGAWKAGDWSITPQLGVAAGYNTNLRLQSSERIESPFVAVLPSLAVARARGEDTLEFDWRSEWTRFTASRADDTLNSEVSASGLSVLGAHTAATWNFAVQDWHDAIGLASADAVAQTPDHFHAAAFGAVLRHDDDDAGTHRLEVEPTVSSKRYVNHRELTAEADADTASLVGRYLWMYEAGHRIGPELRVLRTSYPHSTEGLSNTDMRGFATLKWDAGADSGGSIAVGAQRRRLQQPRLNYFGLAWEADWQWQLDARTQASASTSRGAADAPGEGVDEVVSRRASVALGHDWSASWHGVVSASTSVNHYVGSPVSRDDRVQGLDLVLRNDLSRTWRLSLNLGWMKRRSEIEVFNFERLLGSLELSAAI